MAFLWWWQVMVTVVNGGEVVSGGGFGEAEKELRAVFKRAEEYVGADKGDQIGKVREGTWWTVQALRSLLYRGLMSYLSLPSCLAAPLLLDLSGRDGRSLCLFTLLSYSNSIGPPPGFTKPWPRRPSPTPNTSSRCY